MAAEPKPAGIVGERVAAALKRLRRGTSTYELSRQLADIGWQIRPNGLTRVENGERRVDVDDLLALAVVLGVSPNRLLLPAFEEHPPGTLRAVPVVGNVVATDLDLWAWATGERPLVPLARMPDGALLPGAAPLRHEAAEFRAANKPHEFAEFEGVTITEDQIDAVRGIARMISASLNRGMTPAAVRLLIEQSLSIAEESGDGAE